MASRNQNDAWVTGVLREELQCGAAIRLEDERGPFFKEKEPKSLRTLGDVVDFIDGRL